MEKQEFINILKESLEPIKQRLETIERRLETVEQDVNDLNNEKTQLLNSLFIEATSLQYKDGNLDKVRERAEMLIKLIFGKDSDYIDKLKKIDYRPSIASGKEKLLDLISEMRAEVSLSEGFLKNVSLE